MKAAVLEDVEKLKIAAQGDDLEAIKKATDDMLAVSHKMAEEMYKQQGPTPGGPGAGAPGAGGFDPTQAAQAAAGQEAEEKKGPKVVDAEFEKTE